MNRIRRSRISFPQATEFTAPLGEVFIFLSACQLFYAVTNFGNDFIGNKAMYAIGLYFCVWWLRKLYDDYTAK